nr:HIT family protein [Planctomycetota bacterium]
IAGELESSKVYEDDDILAFMDIQPVHPGQTLVIPKKHIDHFSDLDDALATKIFSFAQQISKIIKKKLNPERVGLLVHGYGVAHAHMIVVAQYDKNDITSGAMAKIEEGKVIFTMDNLKIAPRSELDEMAQLIKTDLN